MQRAPSAWRLALVAALLACAPFLRGWLQGEVVFAPLKLLYHFEPWRSLPNAPQPPPWDVLVWDGVAQFYVWRDLIRGGWFGEGAGDWNPYALCGTPLLANSQSAPYYLPHILAMLLPTWLAVGALAYFHLFWAGLGMGLWLRLRGLHTGAFVGMGLWMLSLFFVSWLPLSSVPATLSWFGWLLWGLETVRRRGVGLFEAFGLPLGLMLLAGHLQFAFYGVLLSLLYALWLGYETRAQGKLWQYGLTVGLGYLLGGLFASVQVLPALELAGYSHRQSPPTEAGYAAYVRNALPLFHLITAYFPTAFGDPRAGGYWGAVHYAELALSVGAFGWLLALMGVCRRGQQMLWLGVGLLALLIALGTPLTRLLYFYLPGFSATGSPARVLCLWAFSAAVLAAYGAQEPRAWRTALGVWLAILAGALLLTLTTLPAGVSRAPLWAGIGASALVLTAVALAVGLAWLGLPRLRNALTPAGWLSLLALAPVVVYALGYPWTAPLRAVFPPLPDLPLLNTGERVAVVNTQWNLYEPPPARMPPNTAAMYRLPEVGGYDSLLPRHAKRFLDMLNGQDSAPPENGNMLFVKRVRPELAYLRVRAVLTPDGWVALPPAPVRLQPIEVLPDEESVWARLQTNPFPDAIPVWGDEARKAVQEYGAGALVPNAQVVWEEYGDSYLRLRIINPSQQTAWLLITDTWYPGWRATVNREPVPLLQANGAFRAVPVPPGESVVRMQFQLRYGWIPWLGWLALTFATFLAKLVAPPKRLRAAESLPMHQ
jgi:hypothetical protein